MVTAVLIGLIVLIGAFVVRPKAEPEMTLRTITCDGLTTYQIYVPVNDNGNYVEEYCNIIKNK